MGNGASVRCYDCESSVAPEIWTVIETCCVGHLSYRCSGSSRMRSDQFLRTGSNGHLDQTVVGLAVQSETSVSFHWTFQRECGFHRVPFRPSPSPHLLHLWNPQTPQMQNQVGSAPPRRFAVARSS